MVSVNVGNEGFSIENDLIDGLVARLIARQAVLVTAESCTGGLVSAICTEVAGSSRWFAGGVISYSNQMKTDVLGVEAELIRQYGAVSRAVAQAMAIGALGQGQAHAAIAITGIAGPDGGSDKKPVGTVYIGTAYRASLRERYDKANTCVEHYCFGGNRQRIRWQAVASGLGQMRRQLDEY